MFPVERHPRPRGTMSAPNNNVKILGQTPRTTPSRAALRFVGNGVKGVLGIGGSTDPGGKVRHYYG